MSRFEQIYWWLKNCPELANLWAVSATLQDYTKVVLLAGSDSEYNEASSEQMRGSVHFVSSPKGAVYEDYMIYAYAEYADEQDDFNIERINDVQAAMDWILEQTDKGNKPEIDGETVITVMRMARTPVMQGEDSENRIIRYFIPIRIYYKGKAKRVDVIV